MSHRENLDEKVILQPAPEGRRPYWSPRLIEYGNIQELTQSGFGPGNDGGGPSTFGTL